MRIERLERVEPFITKDGSEIRELAGPPTGNSVNQSLAEATVPPGAETEEHYHGVTEEIYLFTAGAGLMKLGDERSEVSAGDIVVIPPGCPTSCGTRGPRHSSSCAAARLRTRTTTPSWRADRVLHFLK